MINAECTICDNPYDEKDHRPRNLPCGHGFCNICLEETISRGSRDCPVCRKPHGAESATDLPVNYVLENILQSNTSSYMCPKHKTIPIFFLCTTHNIKICHSCAVLDHPPTVCKLSSLEDKVKTVIKNGNKTLQYAEQDLRNYIKVKSTEIKSYDDEVNHVRSQINELSTKMTQIQKQRNTKVVLVEKAKRALIVYNNRQEILKSMEERQQMASSSQNIMKTLEKANNELKQIKDWEESVRKSLNLNNVTLINEVGGFATITKKDVTRSSKVEVNNGKIYIPSLSRSVSPSPSTFKIDDKKLGTEMHNPTIYFKLSNCNSEVGIIYIKVSTDRSQGDQGWQFVWLATGYYGFTYKGVSFKTKSSKWIYLRDYHSEQDDNKKLNKSILKEQGNEIYKEKKRGMVFAHRDKAGFYIITKDCINEPWYGYIGEVVDSMEVIDLIASSSYKINNIKISECGIVMNH